MSLCTVVLATSVGLTQSAPALASDGDVESSRGKFTQSFGYQFASASGVAIDASGRAVVAGTVANTAGDFVVARYRPNGYPDGSFGGGLLGLGGGKVITDLGGNESARDVAIDSAGRIIVAGQNYPESVALARYLPNGKLDASFGGDGRVLVAGMPRVTGVAIDASDRIVVSGWELNVQSNPFLVARFAPDGTLDPTFGEDGFITDSWGPGNNSAQEVAIDASGRIVVAGGPFKFALARYQEDGSPDPSLGGTGKVVTAIPPGFSASAYAMAIGADGRIVLAGYVLFHSPSGTPDVGPDFVLARYLDDGSLDPSFNGNGVRRVAVDDRRSIAYGVAVDPYGRTVVVGEAYPSPNATFAIARVLPNGAPDLGFGGDGTVVTGGFLLGAQSSAAADVALAGGVRPVAVGTTHFGRPDPFFGSFSRSALSVARYRGSPPPP